MASTIETISQMLYVFIHSFIFDVAKTLLLIVKLSSLFNDGKRVHGKLASLLLLLSGPVHGGRLLYGAFACSLGD